MFEDIIQFCQSRNTCCRSRRLTPTSLPGPAGYRPASLILALFNTAPIVKLYPYIFGTLISLLVYPILKFLHI